MLCPRSHVRKGDVRKCTGIPSLVQNKHRKDRLEIRENGYVQVWAEKKGNINWEAGIGGVTLLNIFFNITLTYNHSNVSVIRKIN